MKPESMITQIGNSTYLLCRESASLIMFIGAITTAALDAIRHPSRIRWRETFYYMNMCGPDGFPITTLICFLTGLIIGYQSAVQMHKYGADAFLPVLVGCTVVRELGPLMVAVVATGRAGSAFAAEIGTMKISEEIDAMKTMGLVPERFLVIPKIIAMVMMIPLLTVVGDVVGILGGMLVGYSELGIPIETYYAKTLQWVTLRYFIESIIKSAIFAFIITIVGCWRGFETGADAVAVGKSTTSAVVISILLIIISDTILGKFFNTLFFG